MCLLILKLIQDFTINGLKCNGPNALPIESYLIISCACLLILKPIQGFIMDGLKGAITKQTYL